MNTNDFDFNLPEKLITQAPLEKRDSSKFLVIDRKTHETVDAYFDHILDELNPGDASVMNNTHMFPTRLYDEKPNTHSHAELLLLKSTQDDQWEVLTKPAERLRVGAKVSFGDGRLTTTVVEELDHGGRIAEFAYDDTFLEALESLGEVPLPPYIHEKLDDPNRYQTVCAKKNGSAVAPIARLHSTRDLLAKIKAKGIRPVYLTLHVGLGIFRPVSVDNVEEHEIHSEFYMLSEEATQTLRDVKAAGRHVTTVGTTSIRTFETIGSKFSGDIKTDSGWTNILIKPGYEFKVVDTFSTNFRLPKSTLVILVSAFVGRGFVLDVYQHAIDKHYRFLSFGDTMFVK